MKKLRIAQVGPLWENIPPPKYGGTERIVYYLTQGLVADGHDVTLFAVGTAKTSAKLVPVYPRPLFRDGISWTNVMYPLLNITQALDRQNNFDIIHIHLNIPGDYVSLPLANHLKSKVIFTVHFPPPLSQGFNDRHLVLQKYKEANFISISNSQRQGEENLHWLKTIYNGVDLGVFTFNPQPKDYFFWLGKIKPEKGAKEAILAARRAGVKLILAGTVDYLEKDYYLYFQEEIKPLIDDKHIIYMGELDDREKNKAYGEAIGFLNPVQWEEPFGLVMVESMATGTPVIAFNKGASSEIITDGETGYLVNNLDQMVESIKKIAAIDRQKCRERVEAMFTTEIMVKNYEKTYYQILAG